jgi:tetratricopeptide (TPR) repeat protein
VVNWFASSEMCRVIPFVCIALVMILTAPLCLAQNKKESNEKARSSYRKYSSKVGNDAAALLEEANELKNSQPGEALNRVEEALGISVAQGDLLNQGKGYLLIGEINENIEEWKLARDNYLRAYERLSVDYSATPEFRRALQGLGSTNLKLSKYEEALRYLKHAASLSGADAAYTAERYLDISEVYYQMGNYAESLNALESIPAEYKNTFTSIGSRSENQRAKINARLSLPVEDKNIYESPLNTLRSTRTADAAQQQSLQNAKEDIADVLRDQQKYDEEISLRNQSIEYNLESNNLSEVTKDKVEIGKTLIAKGEDVAALKALEEAARIASELDNPNEQAHAFLALANQYEKTGKTQQALAAYRKYSQAIAKAVKASEDELIEKSTLTDKVKDIEELTADVSIGRQEYSLEMATVNRQQLIIYGLLLIIAIVVITSYFIYKNAQASKLANQLLALKSLRSQMNPHFIFNALNSVNQFIMHQDERTANKFLSEFSQLMRLVLENSQEDFIPLSKEQEILALYLKLEHYRFRDKFDYEIKVDPALQSDSIEVPPMLIQPYIENAVWHGLRYKESKGKLALKFVSDNGGLVVEITDDGIGRKRSTELKTENQKKQHSTGLKNIQERLRIINKVYRVNCHVSISDIGENTGTRVLLHLPIRQAV